MEIIAIQAHPKVGSGKEDTKKIRNSGLVPAVMYQSGGGDALHFAVSLSDFRPLVYTSKFRLAEVNLDGATYKCILKDIQFHPVNDSVLHIDFLQLVPGKKFKATVPVRFVGTAPGVKEGGKFIPKLRQVNIMTTPEKAVDEVTANIAGMDLGSTIRVRDIETQEGVEITNNGAIPIASIEIPRALRSK
jgi:large subunit ribosomal protein L25